MNTITAIKKYFSTPERPVENKEVLELLKTMKEPERDEMGQACCKALGEAWSKGS